MFSRVGIGFGLVLFIAAAPLPTGAPLAAPPCGTPKGGPCEPPPPPPPPPNLGPHCVSVEDCLGQMSLDEKIGQMTQVQHLALINDSDIATYALGSLLSGGGGAPRTGNTPQDWADMVDAYQTLALSSTLGIPLIYGVDAVHGHNNVLGATIFPHNIGLGATRNPGLVRAVGEITAREVYATGIPWTFSPCLCVSRDERWGRSYESFGEHPEIAAMMTSIIEGYQGIDAFELAGPDTILATAKHWIGDGGTAGGADQGDAQISEAELRAVHMPPFEAAIAAGVGSVMISFSSWNGDKLHGHDYLINGVLKGELNFQGFVVSDWGGIDQLPGDYASDVRTAINAGIDMVMVPDNYRVFIDTLRAEVQAGNVSEARIDDAVTRILNAKFALGLFDQPYLDDHALLGEIGSAAHRAVARQAVRESLVLLKNDGVLPLPKETGTIVVAGKSADDIGNQSGGWTISWQGQSGDITPGTTVLEAVRAAVGPGTTVVHESRPGRRVSGDFGIVVIGERPYAEGQGDDQHLGLDSEDSRAVQNVCAAMRCVVVLISGRPMLIEPQLAQAGAFVAAWLPGTEGDGIADVLFGDHDFAGTLPVSWPRSMDQVPINTGDPVYDPLFPYGFGLTHGP